MNKAITQGLALMPPPFSSNLALWSRDDGRPGDGSYAGQANAAFVAADQDFGTCLELQKTLSTQKLRCFQQIPIQPGLYLRVTIRVKAISGALPSVRIAGWAGNSSGANVTSAVQVGPTTTLTSYGSVVTISAIIGSGNRQGVNMVWGTAPVYGHFGLDLTGATGGVVRIDDVTIEDVTGVFHLDMFDWVDVKDYGAIGNGVADDRAAFEADLAALGKKVVVSTGNYFIGSNLTFENPVEFAGRITMPATARLACTRNFDLDTYSAAFGSELEGFRRALQALFYFTDHVSLDLNGRRVELNAPIDVSALCGLTTFAQRRVLTHGQLSVTPGTAWDTQTLTAVATYSTAAPGILTAVANIAAIPVGARVSGTGVGREVYVTAKNVGAGTLTLSQPLWAAAGTRTFTFQRYRYMLDFSGFSDMSKFEITDMEFLCGGNASAVMLARQGQSFRLNSCVINAPKDRGITSIGFACQDLGLENSQFLSNETALPAQNRTTIAFNVNANDAKIRHNRAVRWAHFGVMAGSGHMIVGNHFFQGDDETAGLRRAGIVFTTPNVKSYVTGNYIDNCFIELSNEHDNDPNYSAGFSFGGLTLTANLFLISNTGTAARCLVVTPRGSGHSINGLTVSGNVFRAASGAIDRVEMVDTSFATLNFQSFRNICFEGNTFHGISQATVSPLQIEHTQATAADTWVVSGGAYMPFLSRARNVVGFVAKGAITNASNVAQYVMPHTLVEQGASLNQVHLKWPTLVKGVMQVTIRCDTPI
jgi:hypothetical protein